MALDFGADFAVFFDTGGFAEQAAYLPAGGGERPLAVIFDATVAPLEAGGATVQVPMRKVLAPAVALVGLPFGRGDRLRVDTGPQAGTYTVNNRRLEDAGDVEVIGLGAAV
jgi:hypothetical protein